MHTMLFMQSLLSFLEPFQAGVVKWRVYLAPKQGGYATVRFPTKLSVCNPFSNILGWPTTGDPNALIWSTPADTVDG